MRGACSEILDISMLNIRCLASAIFMFSWVFIVGGTKKIVFSLDVGDANILIQLCPNYANNAY